MTSNLASFQEKNKFGDDAHKAARTQFYPKLFNTNFENIKFKNVSILKEDVYISSIGLGKSVAERSDIEKKAIIKSIRHNIYDTELKIDRIIHIPWRKHYITFTIQERFRDISHQNRQDITISEYSNKKEEPMELYKLPCVSLFVYGYYDDINNKITQAVAINPTQLLFNDVFNNERKNGMINGMKITQKQNPQKQDFITISFEDLRNKGFILYEYKPKTIDEEKEIKQQKQVNDFVNKHDIFNKKK